MRYGRLAAAGVIPPGADALAFVASLKDSAETVLPSHGPLPAATAEETERLLRWLESPTIRLIEVDGEWTCPADVARIPEVAEAIAALEGVSEVYSVTGQIDLIALVRVRNHDDVATVVADQLNKVAGVTDTETHIAFRAYSRHDLESAFSLGLD
eukprot:gene17458-21352_t